MARSCMSGVRIESFAPIAGRGARVLVLGSMPGAASLAAGRYYAHPHNAFWRLMDALFGAGPALPYAERTRILRRRGVAVWDVLASCVREGSLDSAIEDATARANDFPAFFARHPGIGHVFFNGAKAEASYRRHVLAVHGPALPALRYLRLPSTSPAHAALGYADKRAAWDALRRALEKE